MPCSRAASLLLSGCSRWERLCSLCLPVGPLPPSPPLLPRSGCDVCCPPRPSLSSLELGSRSLRPPRSVSEPGRVESDAFKGALAGRSACTPSAFLPGTSLASSRARASCGGKGGGGGISETWGGSVGACAGGAWECTAGGVCMCRRRCVLVCSMMCVITCQARVPGHGTSRQVPRCTGSRCLHSAGNGSPIICRSHSRLLSGSAGLSDGTDSPAKLSPETMHATQHDNHTDGSAGASS